MKIHVTVLLSMLNVCCEKTETCTIHGTAVSDDTHNASKCSASAPNISILHSGILTFRLCVAIPRHLGFHFAKNGRFQRCKQCPVADLGGGGVLPVS